MRLGDLLTQRGLVTKEQVQEALQKKAPGEFLGQTLVRLGFVSEVIALHALSEQFQIPIVELSGAVIDASLLAGPALKIALQHKIVPLERANGVVRVAITDPFDTRATEELASALASEVKPLLARSSDIERVLEEFRSATPRRAKATVTNLLKQLRGELEAEQLAAEELAGAVDQARSTGNPAPLVAVAKKCGAEAAERMDRCLRLLDG